MPKGVTAKFVFMGWQWRVCVAKTRPRDSWNATKEMYTTASRRLDWYKVHQGGGWIGKVTRACHSSLGQVSALEADDRVPFFGANSVIKAVCCRGDLIGSLSPLDVVPVGHAQWHSVLVIIFIAATALAVGGSALRARWPNTMAPSMVVLPARPVARNSRSPGR